MKTLKILDVPVGEWSVEQLGKDAVDAVAGERGQVVFACANPHSLVVAQTDLACREALCGATHVLADGVGLTMAMRFLYGVSPPRVTGSDLFLGVMGAVTQSAAAQGRRPRVFFLGSTENTLSGIRARLKREFPQAELAGTLSPPFGAWGREVDDWLLETIAEAAPDVLWVGMTAPRQEKWVAANLPMLKVPVIGSIGAVFDFYAGTVPRAPKAFCAMGLEWLYRLAREPKRMWRRNFVSTPKFLGLMLQERLARAHVWPLRRSDELAR